MTESDMAALEKENLEAHVELCSMRYKQLENRLNILEIKFDRLTESIASGANGTKTVIITSAASIVAGILGLITTILMKF